MSVWDLKQIVEFNHTRISKFIDEKQDALIGLARSIKVDLNEDYTKYVFDNTVLPLELVEMAKDEVEYLSDTQENIVHVVEFVGSLLKEVDDIGILHDPNTTNAILEAFTCARAGETALSPRFYVNSSTKTQVRYSTANIAFIQTYLKAMYNNQQYIMALWTDEECVDNRRKLLALLVRVWIELSIEYALMLKHHNVEYLMKLNDMIVEDSYNVEIEDGEERTIKTIVYLKEEYFESSDVISVPDEIVKLSDLLAHLYEEDLKALEAFEEAKENELA